MAIAKITGSRSRQLHQRVPPTSEPLPVRSPFLPGPAGQREGEGRRPGRLHPSELPRARAARRIAGALNAELAKRCDQDLEPHAPRQAGNEGELCSPRTVQRCSTCPGQAFDAAAVTQALRQLAVAGAVRYQPLLGAGEVRSPADHDRGDGRRGPTRLRRTGSSPDTALLGAGAVPIRSGPLPGALGKKPGGFDRPAVGAVAAARVLRRARAGCGAEQRPGNPRFIRVLRLLEIYSLKQLTDAVEYALGIDVHDADRIRVIVEHRRERRSRSSRSTVGPTWRCARGVTDVAAYGPADGGRAMTQPTNTVLLKHHLKKLKLPTMHGECEKMATRANDESRSPGLSAERLRTGTGRPGTEGGGAAAEGRPVPGAKTLDEFDFDRPASVNKPLVLELAKGD